MKAVTRLYCDVLSCRSQIWTYLDVRIKFCTTTMQSVERERDNIVGYRACMCVYIYIYIYVGHTDSNEQQFFF